MDFEIERNVNGLHSSFDWLLLQSQVNRTDSHDLIASIWNLDLTLISHPNKSKLPYFIINSWIRVTELKWVQILILQRCGLCAYLQAYMPITVHTSGTPILRCRAGRLDGSSTIAKCNENGTHDCKHPKRRCTPLVPHLNSLGIQCTWFLINMMKSKTNWCKIYNKSEIENFIVMNKNAQNFDKSWMKDVQIHDVVSTNRAVVNYDVPGPERHCIPLLDFKSLLRCCWLNENTNNSWNTHSKHIFDVFWKFEKENLSTVAGLAHSDSRR